MPPFAPDGHVPLMTLLQEMGKVDPAWTGGEVLTEPVIEVSDAEFDRRAFVIFTYEIANNSELARKEDAIRAEIRQNYEEEIAPRRRRQAVVHKCLELLYRGVLPSIAFGSNGNIYEVPRQIWAAEGAEEIFDTGILLARDGELVFRRRLTQGENTALVLVKDENIKNIVTHLSAGECLATMASSPESTGPSSPETGHPYQYPSGYSGRPSIKKLILAEFERRASLGEISESLAGEARYLLVWVEQAHPNAPHPPTARTIENQIRASYNSYQRRNPGNSTK